MATDEAAEFAEFQAKKAADLEAAKVAEAPLEVKLKAFLVKLAHQVGASGLVSELEEVFRQPEVEEGEEKNA